VKKQQFILAGAGLFVLFALFFFGKTIPPKKASTGEAAVAARPMEVADILKVSKSRLPVSQQAYVNRLENSVVRGDVNIQQISAYRQLAAFWKDSVQEGFLPFIYYTGEIAKLENSEKSLTFAAQLFLENLRGQDEPALKSWMANQAKGLFQKALQLNPANDSSKIGLGACYIFGSTAGDPQEVMQGIQQILEVSRRDTSNMYAEFMLGLGGAVSGQLDKAIERLTKVVAHQPDNIEALLTLAQVNEQKGNKAQAIKWYELSKKSIVNPSVIKEIDQRIKLLR